VRHTRYRIMRAYAVILVAAGITTGSVSLLLAAAVPLVFALYGALSSSPVIKGDIKLNRKISPKTPLPGQPVDVTLTVRNTGETAIPDLRFVDGVPEELGVTEGSPRAGSAIAGGSEFSTTYTLAADRGTYTFDDVTVSARNLNGTRVDGAKIEATGVTDFDCRVAVEDIPVQQTTSYTGQLATDSGGPGVEFYATREYRPEDPVKRINWRQYAKTGKLATIDYREQHAAHVVVLTDSRPATEVCNAAASGKTGRVDNINHSNSSTTAGPTGTDPHGEAASSPVADGGVDWQRLQSLVPPGAQVMLCTPATDGAIVDLVESLRGDAHEVTVLSPQTAPETVGGRIVALQRSVRLDRLRFLGATVVDWERTEKLPAALARSLDVGVQ